MSDFQEHAKNHLRIAAGTYIRADYPNLDCLKNSAMCCGALGCLEHIPNLPDVLAYKKAESSHDLTGCCNCC